MRREIKEKWIAAKYIAKRYTWTPHLRGIFGQKTAPLQKALWAALYKSDVASVLRYIILGADPGRYSERENMSLLMRAIDMENTAMIEMALMWMEDIKGCDDRGWSVMHYAVSKQQIR